MKTGLVLEGGAMRGLFTAGVLDILMENGVEFQGVAGVSAGATFGCNYKSKQIGRTLRYNKRFCRDPRYCSFRSLLLKGDLYGAKFCYNTLPRKLDRFDFRTFEKNPVEFYVVVTDVYTGKPVYKKLTDGRKKDMELIRASASMPVFSTPVEVDGGVYLDGGMADSIPIKFFEGIGYEKNVVILTQPAGYEKKQSPLFPVLGLLMRDYPAVVKAMERRPEEYNDTLCYIAMQEQAGKVLAIRPPKTLRIGKIEHDPEKIEEVYRIGRQEGEKRLPEIRSFLKEVTG